MLTGFNAKTSKFDGVKSSAKISVFDNADGTITKHISASPVNFKNAKGSWQPINTALTQAASGRWQDSANGFTTSFGVGAGARGRSAGASSPSASADQATSPASALADISLSPSESFAWSLEGAAQVTPKVSGDTATYTNILPDTTLILENQAWGVREYFRLSSASAGNSWTFPLSLTGVSLNHASDGSWQLVNGSGALVGVLDAPWAMDSNFNPHTGVSAQTQDASYSLTTVGGVEELTLTLSKSWLDDPSRVFPVTVDPTVTVTLPNSTATLSTYADTHCTSNCITNSDSARMAVGNISGTGDLARSFVEFPSTDIVDTHAHVYSASLDAFMFWTGNTTDLETNSSGDNSLEVGPLNSAIPTSGTLVWPGPEMNTKYGDGVWTSGDGWSSASSCSDITNAGYETNVNRWVYDNISDMSYFDNWAQGKDPYYGFFLAGVNDIANNLPGGNSWKQFASASDGNCAPYLSITEYVEQTPQITSMTPAVNTTESTLTPTLAATATSGDPWNPALEFDFTVYSGSTGSSVVDSGWVSATDSNSVWSAKWAVPSGKLSWGQTYTWRVQAYDGYGTSAGYSSVSYYPFSTTAPPPLLTTGLSQNTGGHGFDAALGNYTTSATDAKVPGYGPTLAIDRDYNSLDPRRSQALGAGWSSILDARIDQVEDGSGHLLEAVVTDPDGSQSPYGLNAGGDYSPPQGTFGTLTYSSSNGYTLTDQNDTIYTFGKNVTPSGQDAQVWGLTSITNAQGQTLSLAYNASGQVSQLTGASGRHLYVTWQSAIGSGAQVEHVSSISTDPITAGGSNPLTWTYNYSSDDLMSVCDPDQHCTKYTYQYGSEYQNAVLNSAPASYWPLDEPAGATKAVSAVLANEQADAGTYSNVTTGVSGTPLNGSTATVAQFNGSSSQVQSTEKSIVSATGDFTVSAWVNMSSASGVQDVVTEDGAYNSAFYLEMNAGHWVFARVQSDVAAGSAAIRAQDTNTVKTGAWYFLAGTYDPGTGLMSLYVNGTQVATATDNAPFAGNGVIAIGRGMWASKDTNYLSGDISDVAVWNQDLSGVELGNMYHIGMNPSAMLTSITDPAEVSSGTATEKATYDTVTGRVTDVWEGGGEYQVSAPSVTGSSQVFASSVLGSEPAYYYRLNEGAGATSALNQVNSGAGTYNAVTLGGTGEFADATSGAFNGSSSYVSATGPSISKTGGFSVAAWAKANTTTGFMDVVSQSMTVDASFELKYDPNVKTWEFARTTSDAQSPGFVEAAGGPTVVAGTWYYLLGTYNAANGQMVLYVNGSQVATATDSSPMAASGNLQIGRVLYESGYTAYFNGSISDVAMWRNTVDSQTASNLYTSAKNSKGIAPVESVTVTDPQNNSSIYRYDPLNGNRLVSETDARGYTTTYGYDTRGFLNTVTDPNGDVTTTEHDVRGNQVSKTTCQDIATDACSTAYWTYYPDDTTAILTTASPENNQVLTYRAPDSSSSTDTTYETTYAYDNLGDQKSVTSPAVTTETYANGTYTAASSKAGLTTTKTYEGETSGSTTYTQLAYGSTSVDVPKGLLLSTTTAGGAVTTYSYYADGDLAQVVNALGEVTAYTYDNLGRVVNKTVDWTTLYSGAHEFLTAATTYTYNGENQTLTETDPSTTDAVTGATHQKQTTNTYDADGNLSQQVVTDLGTGQDAARTTSWTYTPYDQVASETDPDGNKTSTTYTASGLKATVTDPEGNVTAYQYDADGNLTTTILQNYNGSNSDATTAGPLTVESRAYDPADRLASVINGTGVQTVYTYYDNNLKASVTTLSADGKSSYTDEKDYYDGSGNLTAKTTDNGAITTDYTVDADGRVIQTTIDPTGVDQVTSTTYFADSTPATVTTVADGTAREHEYIDDSAGNVLSDTLVADGVNRVTTNTRDTRGLVETTKDPAGNTTTYLYDTLGRRTTVEQPAVSATTFDPNALSATTATAVPTTTTGYNTFGQQAETKDADGNVTTYYFDADGNTTEVVGASYTAPGSTTTLTPTEKRTYTADGQLYQDTDPDGNVTTYGYDQFGHQVSVKDPDGGTSTTSYNSAGQETKHVTAAGVTTGAAYDNLGRVASTSIYEYVTNTTDTTTNSYDWAGRVQKTTSPLGVTTGYGYDDLGEKTSVTDGAGNTTAYAYDGFGDVAKTTYPNGTYTQAVTNALGEVSSTATYDSSGKELSSSSATYDLDGAQTSRTNALGVTETFTVDATGLVTGESQPVSSSSSITTALGYDLDGQETAFTGGNGNTTYWTFNSLGKQNSKTVPATSAYSGVSNQNTDFSYDADGRLTSVQQPGGVAQSYVYDGVGDMTAEYGYVSGTEQLTDTFSYDSDGHPTSAVSCSDADCKSVVNSEGFSWNDEGEVVSATGSAGSSSFTYNNDGQMASRTDASGTTDYSYNSAGQLAAVQGPSAMPLSVFGSCCESQAGAGPGGLRCLVYQVFGVGEVDGGRAGVADAGIVVAFDAVGVVTRAFGDTRVGAVADGVEGSLGGDLVAGEGVELGLPFRGKKPGDRRSPGVRAASWRRT